MLRGVATVNYFADDLDAARRWYTDLLGIEPYFVRPEEGPPGYVEFRIGDFQAELGIISNQWMPRPQVPAAGSVVYWAVDDVEAAIARLLSLGCTRAGPDHAPGVRVRDRIRGRSVRQHPRRDVQPALPVDRRVRGPIRRLTDRRTRPADPPPVGAPGCRSDAAERRSVHLNV